MCAIHAVINEVLYDIIKEHSPEISMIYW